MFLIRFKDTQVKASMDGKEHDMQLVEHLKRTLPATLSTQIRTNYVMEKGSTNRQLKCELTAGIISQRRYNVRVYPDLPDLDMFVRISEDVNKVARPHAYKLHPVRQPQILARPQFRPSAFLPCLAQQQAAPQPCQFPCPAQPAFQQRSFPAPQQPRPAQQTFGNNWHPQGTMSAPAAHDSPMQINKLKAIKEGLCFQCGLKDHHSSWHNQQLAGRICQLVDDSAAQGELNKEEWAAYHEEYDRQEASAQAHEAYHTSHKHDEQGHCAVEELSAPNPDSQDF